MNPAGAGKARTVAQGSRPPTPANRQALSHCRSHPGAGPEWPGRSAAASLRSRSCHKRHLWPQSALDSSLFLSTPTASPARTRFVASLSICRQLIVPAPHLLPAPHHGPSPRKNCPSCGHRPLEGLSKKDHSAYAWIMWKQTHGIT